MRNEELFSKQASAYAQFRPTYPQPLFQYLASLAPDRRLAWDCATGSGQSAQGLALLFNQVIATDANIKQIKQANPNPVICYVMSRAEQATLASQSASLITVSQALHWFSLESFYEEANRILKPHGILAVWCYHLPIISPEIDAVFKRLMNDVTGPYWAPNRRLIDDHYRSILFPFSELTTPDFSIQQNWDFAHLKGYIESWSATQKFKEVNGYHPLALVKEELLSSWGKPAKSYLVRWPLYLRVGTI